jgi:nitrile hydratase subunit alpha
MAHDPHDHEHAHDHEHDHPHAHAHDHDHAPGADAHAPIGAAEPDGYYQRLAEATRSLLIEKGYFTADQMRAMIEKIDARSPALGARIVAKAWTEPKFKKKLLDSGKKALAEIGVDLPIAELVVVENTPRVHNVVVCTLCSCYPVFVLGRPPDWYKNAPYRSRVVKDPRGVLKEFGTEIAADRQVRVHDSTADMRYLVLPMRPKGTEGWSAAALEKIVTRDTMIGVAEPRLES